MGIPSATAVIILNWKRPQNIGRIVRLTSDALPQATIFVIDHGEGLDRLADRHDVPLDRCWVRTQTNAGPGVRFKLAAEWPFDRYLCIDDDTFLTIDQIQALMDKLQQNPDGAHGVIGQMFVQEPSYIEKVKVTGDGEVSILNCVYAFGRSRALATLQLAASLGYKSWDDVARTDDILLSCAGPSRIHNLGSIEQCDTSSAEGIATVRTSGFQEERNDLIIELKRRGILSLHVQSASSNSRSRRVLMRGKLSKTIPAAP